MIPTMSGETEVECLGQEIEDPYPSTARVRCGHGNREPGGESRADATAMSWKSDGRTDLA